MTLGYDGHARLASAETITYTYDAKGRVVKVVRTGSVNNNVTVDYEHDKADNRTHPKSVIPSHEGRLFRPSISIIPYRIRWIAL